MNVGKERRAGGHASRLAERSAERLRSVGRSHGGVMVLVAGLAILRVVSFIAFSTLLGVGASDFQAFRTVIILDGALSVLLDIVVVFVALMVFSAIRRIENESDRMQVFMDSVYRRLP
jgi:hypothetical protein